MLCPCTTLATARVFVVHANTGSGNAMEHAQDECLWVLAKLPFSHGRLSIALNVDQHVHTLSLRDVSHLGWCKLGDVSHLGWCKLGDVSHLGWCKLGDVSHLAGASWASLFELPLCSLWKLQTGHSIRLAQLCFDRCMELWMGLPLA